MNKEKYNDPTADKAIANVMREEKKKKAVERNEYFCKNESGIPGSRQK